MNASGLTVAAVDDQQAATIAAIEASTFDTPWPEDALRDLLRDGLTRGFVVAQRGQTLGAALVRVVAGEGELLRIAVRPDARQRGVGRVLLAAVLDAVAVACPGGVHLEVRASNVAARRLYARVGFTEHGRRPGYYRGPDEDAVLMHWQPGEVPAGARSEA